MSELSARAVRPDQLQVEFGLSFSATGNVIVAGSTVEATLKVSITYDRHDQPTPTVVPAGAATTTPVSGV